MDDVYQFTVGGFECLAIDDGRFAGNADVLFSNAPEAELPAVLQRYGLEPDHLPSTLTCLLVKSDSNVVLVDTGLGTISGFGGQLLAKLETAGIKPANVDTVILTHAHGDHIGGCVDDAGRLTFPEATHYMWRDEWNFWTSEKELAKLPDMAAKVARRSLPPLRPQLELIDAEVEIVSGVRAIAAPGHTAGHIAVEVESLGETLLDIIDTALHPIHIEYPAWYSRLDQFPALTVATRRAIYRRAAEKRALVLAFHFPPFPSLGHIIRGEERWMWQPVEIAR